MKTKPLTEQIRQFNRFLHGPDGHFPDLQRVTAALAEAANAAAFVVSNNGALLSGHTGSFKIDEKLRLLIDKGDLASSAAYMKLIKTNEPLYNEAYPAGSKGEGKKDYFTVIPVTANDKDSTLLVFNRPQKTLSDPDIALGEVGALLIGIILHHEVAEKEEAESRNRKLAEGAFESLSYSEVEAIREILKNISNNESVVIASKIADSLGITRSVIVNALRKFESAGIIDTRSLGMKGTFIRVKNLHALELIASRSARSGPYA